jgi:hypothetical protein
VPLTFVIVSIVLAGWALSARRLERLLITSPLFLVLAGAAVEHVTYGSLADTLNSENRPARCRGHPRGAAVRRRQCDSCRAVR